MEQIHNKERTIKKRYSFLNMKRAIRSDGTEFIGVTVEGLLCRPMAIQHVKDKLVLNASLPVYHRAQAIQNMCGACPAESQQGIIWVQVSFWQKESAQSGLVTRLDRLIRAHAGKNLVLVLTGAMRMDCGYGKTGKIYQNLKITADDFILLRTAVQNPLEGKEWNAAASRSKETTRDTNSNFNEMDIDLEELIF